jgi:caffeoyl-CoA O-methyltransferase
MPGPGRYRSRFGFDFATVHQHQQRAVIDVTQNCVSATLRLDCSQQLFKFVFSERGFMKARLDAIIQHNQAEYLEQLHTQPDPLLSEMEAFGGEHNVPSADREVARFVEITARAIKAKCALEIGMAIGYTTNHLARAVGHDGLVVTIDPSDEMIKNAESYLTRAGLRERVRIERGKALEVLPNLNDTFDLVFIDAVKQEYAGYLDLALPRLRSGGVVIVDNLLWGGQVAGEIRAPDQEESTRALREFNQKFVNHPQLLAEVLSVGDGVGYGVKI